MFLYVQVRRFVDIVAHVDLEALFLVGTYSVHWDVGRSGHRNQQVAEILRCNGDQSPSPAGADNPSNCLYLVTTVVSYQTLHDLMVAAEAVVAHGQRVKSRPSVGEQALKKPGGTKVERHVPIDGVASLGRKGGVRASSDGRMTGYRRV